VRVLRHARSLRRAAPPLASRLVTLGKRKSRSLLMRKNVKPEDLKKPLHGGCTVVYLSSSAIYHPHGILNEDP